MTMQQPRLEAKELLKSKTVAQRVSEFASEKSSTAIEGGIQAVIKIARDRRAEARRAADAIKEALRRTQYEEFAANKQFSQIPLHERGEYLLQHSSKCDAKIFDYTMHKEHTYLATSVGLLQFDMEGALIGVMSYEAGIFSGFSDEGRIRDVTSVVIDSDGTIFVILRHNLAVSTDGGQRFITVLPCDVSIGFVRYRTEYRVSQYGPYYEGLLLGGMKAGISGDTLRTGGYSLSISKIKEAAACANWGSCDCNCALYAPHKMVYVSY